MKTTFGRWHRTFMPGHYISDNDKWTATLRGPGTYHGTKMLRHYLIKRKGSDQTYAVELTLKDAEKWIDQ